MKLKVRNFGPIRDGFGDFIDFDKVTVFCGPQGSGKSTVAKLFSTLSWVEKALFRLSFPQVLKSYYARDVFKGSGLAGDSGLSY